MAREILPYGCWPSPITAQMAAGKSLRFGSLLADGGSVYWSESRPEEGGRGVIMAARRDGKVDEILPPPWSARSRVHEYGGGAFLVHGGRLYFVEDESQDIFMLTAGEEPRRLMELPGTRFADMTADPSRPRLVCVAEWHGEGDGDAYPENCLAAVALEGEGEPQALVTGHDFYASPRVSPDGRLLAWLAWDLPHMPWEAAALYVAPIGADGDIDRPERIAGGEGSAVFQPEWTGERTLTFVWDETGWGNLYVWDGANVRSVESREAELLRPQWVFAMQSWAPLGAGSVAAVYLDNGDTDLRVIDTAKGTSRSIDTGLRAIGSLMPFAGDLAVIGAGDRTAPSVMRLPLGGGEAQVLRAGMDTSFAAEDISVPRRLEIACGGGEAIHALYYPPASASCVGLDGALPPVIVTAHGGPTGRADLGFKIRTQYWTGRGFGVCDVDYSGSAGYGRAYRRRLDGQWGLRDVDDLTAAAEHLAAEALADPDRLFISGGSAGGLTVLLALARHDLFAAGACSYAVCDLAQLQRVTHKFEAGYLYALTGTTPADCEPVFAERSPLNLAGKIAAPVIFFQGSDDHVVPPEQTRTMAETLKANGVPVACYEFEGEGHGFRRGETIEAVLGLEYAFYCAILGLEPAVELPTIEIENWPVAASAAGSANHAGR